MSSVKKGQISDVGTEQMSAAERLMSALETRQMLKSQMRGLDLNYQNIVQNRFCDRCLFSLIPSGGQLPKLWIIIPFKY